jgi:hypothetical protein
MAMTGRLGAVESRPGNMRLAARGTATSPRSLAADMPTASAALTRAGVFGRSLTADMPTASSVLTRILPIVFDLFRHVGSRTHRVSRRS